MSAHDNEGAVRLAGETWKAMFEREPTRSDAAALGMLARVFLMAGETAIEQVDSEREACAQIAAEHSATGEFIATLIRARGEL